MIQDHSDNGRLKNEITYSIKTGINLYVHLVQHDSDNLESYLCNWIPTPFTFFGGFIFNFVGFCVIFFYLYHKKINRKIGMFRLLWNHCKVIFFLFHCFQQLIYSRFFSGKSDVDICTNFADRTLINRRNVTSDTHSSY